MKWVKLFICSAGGILLAAGLIRFAIAAGNSQVLALPDPMIGIPLRYAILVVGGIELVVALICLFGKKIGLQLGWLAWLATNYAIYRVGLLTMHYHPQATCIGSFTDPLHLTDGITGLIMGFLPFYVLAGSYAAMVWFWLEGRRAKAAKFIKMSCPACGVHLRFDERNAGQKIPCPHCQASVTLRKSESLKMSCFFCHGHIDFPAHALDTKIACPHCRMDITLKESG